MPQFTPWAITNPAPNVLFNPAAVDQAIAASQSQLGELDINRQKLGLEQRRLDQQQSGGQALIDSLSGKTPGATTTDGAGTQAATTAGDSTTETADDLTRAAAVRDGLIKRGMQPDGATAFAANALHESKANPFTGAGDAGASHGIFQWNGDRLAAFKAANGGLLPEQTSLDKQLDFVVSELRGPESTAAGRIMSAQGVADKAGQVSEAYLRPKDTVPEMQRRSATALRLARAWGGQGAPGSAPGVSAPGGASTAAVGAPNAPNPNAVTPPLARPTLPPPQPPIAPNAPVVTADANMTAVKQAATGLLAMPEADAAAAYGPTVRSLQAQGFAMNAPATYPGHAALQALVSGNVPTAPGVGTQVAGPGARAGVIPPSMPGTAGDVATMTAAMVARGADPTTLAPGAGSAPSPQGTMVAGTGAGSDTLPPVEAPATLYKPGAPGLQARVSPLAPPPAPSRMIQTEPLLPSNLTQAQVGFLGAMVQSGATTAEVAAKAAQWQHENIAIKQNAATMNAAQQQQDYDRQRQYQQDQIAAQKDAETRAQRELDNKRNAAADTRAEVAAKNAGLPPGYRLSDTGVATRIDGLPPDPAVAEAAKAAWDADQRKNPLQGQDITAQDRNTLQRGDPKSDDYKAAYAAYATPKVQEGGIVIHPDMSPYRLPQDADGNPITTYGKTHISIGPGDLPKLRAFETSSSTLKAALDDFLETTRKSSATDRALTAAGQPTDLSSAWANVALQAKGPGLYELGVLSGPDMEVLRSVLADPGTFRGYMTSPETLNKQAARIRSLLDTRLDQARQSYGGGMGTSPPAATTPPAAPSSTTTREPKEGDTATGPHGTKIILRNGLWELK